MLLISISLLMCLIICFVDCFEICQSIPYIGGVGHERKGQRKCVGQRGKFQTDLSSSRFCMENPLISRQLFIEFRVCLRADDSSKTVTKFYVYFPRPISHAKSNSL